MNNNIVTIPASAAGIRLSVWLAKNGYPVTADCGGKGTCGKCRVYAVSGTFFGDAAKTTVEEPDADCMIRSCHAWCPDGGAEIRLVETVGGVLTEVITDQDTPTFMTSTRSIPRSSSIRWRSSARSRNIICSTRASA